MSSSPDPNELQAALARIVEGEGEPADDLLVAQTLRAHPELIHALRQQLQIDAFLRLEAEPTAQAFVEELAARIRPAQNDSAFVQKIRAALLHPHEKLANQKVVSFWNTCFRWHPLSAAAGGLIFGIFCTSAVWAVSTPRPKTPLKISLPMANPGFEENSPPAAHGIPVASGNWGGDDVEISPLAQNVTPKEGRQMLRFLGSDNAAHTVRDPNPNGNIYQVIDLDSYRTALSDGQAKLDWSAWFQWVPGPDEQGMTFAVNVWSFNGSPSILPTNWKNHLHLETAKSGKKLAFDETPGIWRPLSGSMIVPADANFLVIELKAIPKTSAATAPTYRFHGCYADQVTLTLNYNPEPISDETSRPSRRP